MRTISAHVAVMIRIDEIWLATEPLDMRAGPDTALARVVQVFGSAKSQRAYDLARWAKKCSMRLLSQKVGWCSEVP